MQILPYFSGAYTRNTGRPELGHGICLRLLIYGPRQIRLTPPRHWNELVCSPLGSHHVPLQCFQMLVRNQARLVIVTIGLHYIEIIVQP